MSKTLGPVGRRAVIRVEYAFVERTTGLLWVTV
jgi:hypothetical protein